MPCLVGLETDATFLAQTLAVQVWAEPVAAEAVGHGTGSFVCLRAAHWIVVTQVANPRTIFDTMCIGSIKAQ